jgi:hypothetical protein
MALKYLHHQLVIDAAEMIKTERETKRKNGLWDFRGFL